MSLDFSVNMCYLYFLYYYFHPQTLDRRARKTQMIQPLWQGIHKVHKTVKLKWQDMFLKLCVSCICAGKKRN